MNSVSEAIAQEMWGLKIQLWIWTHPLARTKNLICNAKYAKIYATKFWVLFLTLQESFLFLTDNTLQSLLRNTKTNTAVYHLSKEILADTAIVKFLTWSTVS
jgi:hypothetical protein